MYFSYAVVLLRNYDINNVVFAGFIHSGRGGGLFVTISVRI